MGALNGHHETGVIPHQQRPYSDLCAPTGQCNKAQGWPRPKGAGLPWVSTRAMPTRKGLHTVYSRRFDKYRSFHSRARLRSQTPMVHRTTGRAGNAPFCATLSGLAVGEALHPG